MHRPAHVRPSRDVRAEPRNAVRSATVEAAVAAEHGPFARAGARSGDASRLPQPFRRLARYDRTGVGEERGTWRRALRSELRAAAPSVLVLASTPTRGNARHV